MSLTLTIPTWKQITSMFFLVVAYYATLVEPQYDWWVFGFTYFFGMLIALRSWWRLKYPEFVPNKGYTLEDARQYQYGSGYADWQSYNSLRNIGCLVLCSLWVLCPVFMISSLVVTFGNKKGIK